LHQVGHVAAEAKQFESVGDTKFARRLLQFAVERALAEAPKLCFWQAIQHQCSRLNQFTVALLSREMGECSDDRCIKFGA
jgi:hypothetical protein